MKKILLATTAVVGVALFSPAAMAEISVTTGGYLEFTAGVFDNDLDDSSDRDFQTEAEVFVRADAKADNGLEYGAEIQFNNGESNDLVVDEAFLHLSGSWGRVELGDTDGVVDVMSVYAPVVEGYGQIKTDRDSGANYSDYLGAGPVAQHAVDTDDSTKITYYTPSFALFGAGKLQAGLSYAPEFDEGQGVETSDVGGTYQDLWEAALNYTHDMGNWGFMVGVGLTGGSSRDSAATGDDIYEDFVAWNVGAQVSFGGFTFGGAYVNNEDYLVLEGSDSDDADGWNVGLTYETGPLAVGVSWLTGEGVGTVPGVGAVDFDDYDAYGAGMAYTVAPGLVVQGDLMFVDSEYDAAAGEGDNDGWVLMLGTRMTF